LTETDKRTPQDRRKKPTPALSWYTFLVEGEGFEENLTKKRVGMWTATVQNYSSSSFC
jgi:hypothetical protein